MITLPPSTIAAFAKKLIDNATPNAHIRLGIRGSGGCSDFLFHIDFAEAPTNKDDVFVFDNVKVVIDRKSQKYLDTCTVIYEKSLMGESFKLVSENIVSECGCGKSVSFK